MEQTVASENLDMTSSLVRNDITLLALVVQKMDSAFQWISIRKPNCAIQCIEIYRVDSLIHLLYNWGLTINL